MKPYFYNILLIFAIIFYESTLAQFNGSVYNVSVGYNYTTTSKLYLQPNVSDPVLQTEHQNLDGIYNFSFEFRYKVLENMILGVGSEFIKKTYTNRNFILEGDRLEITEGFILIPVEMVIYYLLPFSTEKFKFLMGGGAGLYFGKHIREIGDVNFISDKLAADFGINVSIGLEYLINNLISIRGQMRFRDPELKLKSKYSSSSVYYNNKNYLLSNKVISTKVNVDGLTFTIGVSFNL